MHEELREKLRQAEIEASLERARLARERASLEEKLRVLEQEKAHASQPTLGRHRQVQDLPPLAGPPRNQGRVSRPILTPQFTRSMPRAVGHGSRFPAGGDSPRNESTNLPKAS